MTDTADLADYVLPATTQLEHLDVHTSYGHTYVLINEPAIAPLGEAKPNTQIFRELAARMGFDEPCFGDDDETLARIAFRPERRRHRLRRAARRRLGQARRSPKRRSPKAASRRASGKRLIDVAGLGVPDHVPNHESAASTPELARRFPLAMISPPARNFLNSTFVNVKSLRAIEGEPVLEIARGRRRARAASSTASGCASSTTAAASSARRVVERARAAGRRQRPRRLVAQARRRRHERQRADAPAAHRHRPRAELLRLPGRGRGRRRRRPRRETRRARRGLGLGGRRRRRSWPAPRVCLTSGCSTIDYYAQSVAGHLGLLAAARPVPEWLADPTTRAALKATPGALAADARLRGHRAERARQRELPPLRRPEARRPRSGTSSPRPSCRLQLEDLVLPGRRLRRLPRLLRRGRGRRARRRPARAKASRSRSTPVPAYSTLGRLPTATGSPTRCSTPSSTTPKASSRA